MIPAFVIQIIIALVVVGLVLWVVGQLPIDAAIQRIIHVVVVVCVLLWLLSLLLGYSGAWVAPVPVHR